MSNTTNNVSEIYRLYSTEVLNYLHYSFQDRTRAEDALAASFEKLLQQKKSIDNPRAWLYTTARNQFINQLKREKKLVHVDSSNRNLDSYIQEIGQSVETELITAELKKIVNQEISDLSPLYREVISLRLYQELKFAEIAEITQEKESTVKLRYYRGIDQIKSQLKKQLHLKKSYSLSLPLVVAAIQDNKEQLIKLKQTKTMENNITDNKTNGTDTVASSEMASTNAAFAKTATPAATYILVGAVALASLVVSGLGGAFLLGAFDNNTENSQESVSFEQIESDGLNNETVSNLETVETVAENEGSSDQVATVFDCGENCDIDDLEIALAALRDENEYTVSAREGFNCIYEIKASFNNGDVNEILTHSGGEGCEAPSGLESRIVDGQAYSKRPGGNWQTALQTNRNGIVYTEPDSRSLSNILPASNINTSGGNFRDEQLDDTFYYLDKFSLVSELDEETRQRLPDGAVYVLDRKIGSRQICATTEQADYGDCGIDRYILGNNLNLIEYTKLGTLFLTSYLYNNLGNTEALEKPI